MKTWHKIALTVAVVAGLIICVKSCVDKEEVDLNVAYIGDGFVQRELFDQNKSMLESVCNDITGDGEAWVDIMEISFNEELSQADKSNSAGKMTNAVGAGAARVYFIEKPYVVQNASAGVFADISALGDGFKNSEKQTVAISIKGNEKVKKLGIDTDKDIYLAVRIVSEMDSLTDKSIEKKHESAMNVAKYILN